MLKKFFACDTKDHIYSKEEEIFFKKIKNIYRIDGKESFFSENYIQQSIYLWADVSDFEYADDFEKGVVVENDSIMQKSKKYIIANEIISVYFQCFAKKRGNNVSVSIFCFNKTLMGFAYGNALRNIRTQLNKKYNIPKRNVVVPHEPKLVILCEDIEQYNILQQKVKMLKHITYLELKKYDGYNVFTQENIVIQLLNVKEIDCDELNHYRREFF